MIKFQFAFLFCVIFRLFIPAESTAQADRWIFFSGSYDDVSFYYDSYSIEYKNYNTTNNRQISVWVKVFYSYNSKEFQENNWNYLIQKWEMDCIRKKITLTDAVIYYTDGTHITSPIYDVQNIVPDTSGEQLYFVLCK